MILQQDEQYRDVTAQIARPRGPVGLVSASGAGLWEVTCGLAREGVGVSRAVIVGRAALEAGLGSLQSDSATEFIVLISEKLSAAAAAPVLDRVRASDKPTVVCLVGGSSHLAWRAGAIPAARLDEAAMRATAWVRGWDQVLVSSKLEEEGDELARLAADLQARIAPGRTGIRGVLAGKILRREAQLMLSLAPGAAPADISLEIALRPSRQEERLHRVLARPETAVLLASLLVDDYLTPDPAGALTAAVERFRKRKATPAERKYGEPLIVAHVLGANCDLERLAAQEARLRGMGAVVMASNAAAARLAGLLVGRGEPPAR